MNLMIEECFGEVLPVHTAAAIGAFDGVHRGHRRILDAAVRYAADHGIASAAVLFDPLPSQLFGRLGMDQRILLRDEQVERIRLAGVDHVIVLPFTRELAALSPEEFLTAMQSRLHCEKLFMGADFSIGKGRSGTPDVLADLGAVLGFETEIVPKEMLDGVRISSTEIRSALQNGQMERAARMLGYPFYFTSRIIHGEARGRNLGFPTLNVKIPEGKVKLPNGVYAVVNTIDGVRYPSVTNIGVRPTFGEDQRGVVVESFLLDTSGDFYGETATLEFIEMLRPERKFASADALREQIARDTERAGSILKNIM